MGKVYSHLSEEERQVIVLSPLGAKGRRPVSSLLEALLLFSWVGFLR